MLIYNLLEYRDSCSMTSGSMWNYYRDEANDNLNENNDDDYKVNNEKAATSKLFEYKKKIIGSIPADNSRLHAEIVVPLKYLSSFRRSFDLSLINCEIELDLSWPRNCIKYEIWRTLGVPASSNPNPPINCVPPAPTTSATFQVNKAKLYVLVVTLSINDNIKFFEPLKQGFRGTVSWKKFRSEIRTEPKIINLHGMIDPTFRNINRLLVLSFKNGDNPTTNSIDKYYMLLVKIKYFNSLIDNKPFFDKPSQN